MTKLDKLIETYITEGLFSNKVYFKHNGDVHKALKYKGQGSAIAKGVLIGTVVPGLGTIVGGVGGALAYRNHQNKLLTLRAIGAKQITKDEYKKLKVRIK